ncbi:hypothetical protein BC939DRAFT_45537 [Gamsiella multidivaricata]|uniref:uncharacterized protein n=1 Tax=Gamsiella multidivaricata TaxID=101098 RepID=UPI0022210B60|nr:uncharacterized protein BC939DRAFT_45537 [Gamsiella multidivaricata]KAI7816406.1 hypothetical protein BC939DRAFT_45537 [Gamsiella multidivaricata]
MTKIQLIKAMQTEHPLRTLDIGALKANTSRALKKEIPYDEDLQDKLRHDVTTCLSDISNLASKSKRACQQVIGNYLESLSVDHLDEDDRTILSYLTPHFSVQEIAAAKKGTTPNPEDESSDDEDDSEASNENKNSPVEFFLPLLIAIYKASTPQEKKKASAAAAACLFLRKAKDYLPPKTGSEPYNNSQSFSSPQRSNSQLSTEGTSRTVPLIFPKRSSSSRRKDSCPRVPQIVSIQTRPQGELYHSEQGHRKKLATITNVTPWKQIRQSLGG